MSTDTEFESPLLRMRLLLAEDVDHFHSLTADEEMWQYFTVNLADDAELKKWMEKALKEKAAGTRLPFTIICKEQNRIAGSMSIANISAYDLRAEIGWSWLGRDFRGRDVNRQAKFLLMRFLFEEWKFERVEFKTDVLNDRAINGLRKIGAREEGILRSHLKMWNNRRRDSIYFSVLKTEWPQLRTTIFKDLA